MPRADGRLGRSPFSELPWNRPALGRRAASSEGLNVEGSVPPTGDVCLPLDGQGRTLEVHSCSRLPPPRLVPVLASSSPAPGEGGRVSVVPASPQAPSLSPQRCGGGAEGTKKKPCHSAPRGTGPCSKDSRALTPRAEPVGTGRWPLRGEKLLMGTASFRRRGCSGTRQRRWPHNAEGTKCH